MKQLFTLSILFCLLGTTYAVNPSGTLPVLYITTENKTPVTSKDYYLNATYYLDAKGIAGYENIGSASAPLNMEIKGRGNYSWTGFNKKPYRIKLADKQPLLGMIKSKHFTLLAHADDAKDKKGYMRNAAGFELSKMLGIAWTPEAKPLELVMNGDYIGLYFLTEQIRVDIDRVNIVEQEDEETDAQKITGGWLVEIDNYDSDPHITIKEGGKTTMWVTYKTPEVLSSAQESYLTNQIQLLDNLIYGDKNSDELWQHLDMDALARFYIVQEITDNYESFHGSCYLYKDMGDDQKWKFGPVWDFGSAFNRDKSQYIYQGDVWHNHWIPEICKFPAFMTRVKAIWQEFYPTRFNDIFTFTADQLTLLKTAAAVDAQRWPDYNGNADLTKRINQINERLRKNAEWLNQQWGGDSNDDNNNNNNNNNNDNNDDNTPTVDETWTMLVWQEGKSVEYTLAQVDSITFVQKEQLVVKAKVPAAWGDDIYVYIWNAQDSNKNGEFRATRQGDWYVYSTDEQSLNIIFKKGKSWTGHPNQSEDIKLTQSACFILTQEGENKAVATQTDCP
ncbi:MAG: CotH kinase family protein [Paludibacteraceae bacterium]|nr:CotH kinase family protein [Paludibacteraceae bacterium]